jgi:hypothetical protein
LDRCSLFDEFERNSSTVLVRKIGLRVSNLIRIEKKKSTKQESLLDYI